MASAGPSPIERDQPADQRVALHVRAVGADADVGQDPVEHLGEQEHDQRDVAEQLAACTAMECSHCARSAS